MCKILMLSNATKVVNPKKLCDTAFELLTKTDDDGFGYAFSGRNGVFGEKTVNKTWKFGSKVPEFAKSTVTEEFFGEVGGLNGPALFHGRTSTNHVNLLNTHPLQKGGWTLIHNGVVSNRGPAYTQTTTNDTEHILHYLADGNGISDIEQYISGYYAIGAIDSKGQLHVVRDNVAQLYVAFSDTIKSYVFATTEKLIVDLCDEMEWHRGTVREYSKAFYTVLQKNKIVAARSIEPLGYGYTESRHAQSSLGYNVGESNSYNTHSGYGHNGYRSKYSTYGNGEGSHYTPRITGNSATVYQNGVVDATSTPIASNELLTASEAEVYERALESDLESFEAWVAEVTNMDSSYCIETEDGKEITVNMFDKMEMKEQLHCKIVRSDGTIVDPYNYFVDRLED